MKRIAFALLFLLFLASACVPAGSQNAPTVSPALTLETSTHLTPDTPTPDTPTPTSEPTATPTETPTPTEVAKIPKPDVANPDALPKSTYEYLNSPAYAKLIMQRQAAGAYDSFPVTVVPLDRGSVKFENAYSSEYYGTYELTPEQVTIYRNHPENRFYQVVEAYQVPLDGGVIGYYILIRVLNPKGPNDAEQSYGFFANEVITSPDQRVEPMLKAYYEIGDSGTMLTPGSFFKNTQACTDYFASIGRNLPSLCEKSVLAHALAAATPVLTSWQNTGILNNKDENGGVVIPMGFWSVSRIIAKNP